MNPLKRLAYLLPSRRRAIDRDIEEELKSLRDIAEPGELGNLTLAAEDARAVFTWMWLERLGQDLRYALRSMAHHKAFTALVVLSLMLGIGANTAIYSFMESVLMRDLPVPEPESLVVLKWRARKFPSTASHGFSLSTGGTYFDPQAGTVGSVFPYPALELFEGNGNVFSSVFCYFAADRLDLMITNEAGAEAVRGQFVSGDYFRGMGIHPAAGRLIQAADDRSGAAGVAVLSYRFARRSFVEAAVAVGQAIRINDKPFVVIGVAPPEFFGAEPGYVPDVYVPMYAWQVLEPAKMYAGVARRYQDPNFYWIEVMGRLRPGVNREQAQAVLAPQFRRFAEDSASSEDERAVLPELMVQSGSRGLDSLRRRYTRPVYLLVGMAGVILLIACANIASLLLARAFARRRELAIRMSMGAGRMRIIRQLLTESVLLASIGGALGVLPASWGIRVLTILLANGRDNFTLHARLNWNVLGFTLALSFLTGLLFGLAPSIQATGFHLMPALKEARAISPAGDARRSWPRFSMVKGLVVAQIAFSFLLVTSAGLFLKTLSNLHSIDVGFDRANVLLFTIRPEGAGYKGAALEGLYADLRQQLKRAPGVRSVSMSSSPLPAGGGTMAPVTVHGAPPSSSAAGNAGIHAGLFSIGPAFFETMQIPLNAGRDFSQNDRAGGAPVAVINELLARRLSLAEPVGRSLDVGRASYRIIGVAGDAKFLTLREDYRPMVYLPYMQGDRPPLQLTFEVRTAGNPLSLAGTVRRIVRATDARLAISGLQTQAAYIDQAISREITLARLSMAFAVLALLIACVGVYGTIAFAVERRTGEIGVRVALGAERKGIVWMILREVLLLALSGLAIGIPAALVAAGSLGSFLYQIHPNDPASILLSVVLLLLAASLAGFLPARRASKIDPIAALRQE